MIDRSKTSAVANRSVDRHLWVMGRRREFQIDEVLARATEVFWRRGYAATAMSDVYEATGLKPGSLYAAFKDKEELFRRCFENYAAFFRRTLPTGQAGLPAIRSWLAFQVRLAADDPERKGCLIVNTLAEREVHSAATRALAQGRLQEIRDFFQRQLAVALERGEVDTGLAVEPAADALTGTVISIMALGRAGADRRMIEHVAQGATATLRRDT
jgi:TetR/AcrR family transcriptional regulator, transcriptional repressor for nem operon